MASNEASEHSGQQVLSGNSVLIVEDSKTISALLATHIGNLNGIEAVTATTQAEAVQLLETDPGRYFVAVTDLKLPDSPQGEVVDYLKTHALPVIVLTGAVDDDLRKSMFQKQIADYVVKGKLTSFEYVFKHIERIHKNRGNKILIVDDSSVFRVYVSDLLVNHGYHTLQANNGLEGLEMLSTHTDISLVVTDYGMPEMNGLEMIEEMRKVKNRDELAIIGLSVSDNPELSSRLLKSGASDFLTKPFQIEEFYCRVDQNLDMVSFVQQARDAVNRDLLTRSFSRRYFFNAGFDLYDKAKTEKLNCYAALVDVDHFKRLNDVHGNEVGDDALVAIANVLMDTVGDAGLVARYGGEEFAVLHILPEGVEPGDVLGEVVKSVEAVVLMHEDVQVPLSVSIGYTSEPGRNLDQMLSRADEALFKAKRGGRNQAVSG